MARTLLDVGRRRRPDFSRRLLPAAAVDWPVFGFDPARSGFNSAERTITVSNVHRLHERWQISLGARRRFDADLCSSTSGSAAPIVRCSFKRRRDGDDARHRGKRRGESSGALRRTARTTPTRRRLPIRRAKRSTRRASTARFISSTLPTGHEIHAPGFPASHHAHAAAPRRTHRRSTSPTAISTRRPPDTTATHRRTTVMSSRYV